MTKALFTALALALPLALHAQPCSTSNAAGCDCLDGSNDCDLLPDIGVSRDLLLDATAQPEIFGQLGVSVSTPNTGHGPLRVVATDYYVCGGDTVHSPGGLVACPDGTPPRQLIQQRVYHKNPDGSMSFYDRWAGSMTYHPTHGHMHVDDWGVYSLRLPTSDPDPLSWPIVAEGAKLGFCLMDYGSCQYYYGHCRDAADNILTTDAPNYGLGGGGYSCGMTNQGISAGWTDIYYHYLDGMQIPIPSTVCNGDYMLVVHVDPYDYFLEENEDNNVQAVPITLSAQTALSAFDLTVEGGSTTICAGTTVELSSPLVGSGYAWSNGATTPTITVDAAGSYSVTVTSPTCGTVTSNPVTIDLSTVEAPVAVGDTVCDLGSLTLSAGPGATGGERWYAAATGGIALDTGATFTTPELSATTTYWVERDATTPGVEAAAGAADHVGSSTYSGNSFNGFLSFDAHQPFTLESVKVYTDLAGPRTIEWRDAGGNLMASRTVSLPVGESRIPLDFAVTPGLDYQLGTNEAANLANFGYSSPRMQRTSDASVSFPYAGADLVTITGSSAGETFYYYFYDWAVRGEDRTCSSPRTPVDAVVRSCTGLDAVLAGGPQLWPNPASGRASLRVSLTRPAELAWELLDLQGRVLRAGAPGRLTGEHVLTLPLEGLAAGTYLVRVTAGGRAYRERLVVASAEGQ